MPEALQPGATPADQEYWDLRLYVTGHADKCGRAINNLSRICHEHIEGRYSIEVIDLLSRPELAEGDQIFAIPTLVRRLPGSIKKIVGDLSDEQRVLIGLAIPIGDGVQITQGTAA